jgi:hypothetical protein
MIKIDKTIKAEIEGAIGKSIPDTQSKEFEMFYEWLVKEHPDLARKLEGSLAVTEPYPEETARRQAERREGIATMLRGMFYKQVWGKSVLNRRALSLTIFFLIFGVMMASWSVTFFRKPSWTEVAQQTTPPVQAPAEHADVTTTETTPADATNLLIVPEVAVKNPPPEKEVQANAPLVVPEIADATPPRTLPQDGGSRPLQTPSVPQETTVSQPEPIPQTSVLAAEEAPPPMPEFSVRVFESVELATKPVMIHSPETVATPQQPVLAFDGGSEVVSTETSVLAQKSLTSGSETLAEAAVTPTESKLATSSVLAFGSEDTYTQSSLGTEHQDSSNDEDVMTELPPSALESTPSSETTFEGVPPTSLATNADGELLETDLFNGKASDLLRSGMLIPATLQKDIILTQGETRQVLADAVVGWCGEADCPSLRLLGTASLSEGGRLDVIFEEAVLEGEVMELSGIAYGADNAEGLPAHIADTTPTLLADSLRAGAGGLTDYVEAETNRKTVIRNGDSTVTETTVPGLLEFVLGRAAGSLQIPEGETSVIRLAAVEKGTRLEVLYFEK